MSLYFTSNIQESEFNRKIAEMQKKVQSFGGTVTKEANSMDAAWGKFSSTIGSAVTLYGMQELARTIVNVRGEMQTLSLAYNTIIGDAVKGQKLLQETIAFAAETPFNVLEVGRATKQLLAYGSSAESVNGELRMLGDIAAGAKIPLGDLIYLYGTLRTQNRALALDIRQFAGRGIPIYTELAKVMGVNVTQLNKMVAESQVYFSHVQTAFKNMTTEGGMFANLMDQMAQTVTGRLSNLEDVITQMWNQIGEAQEGVIYSSIEGAHFLVENYETVLKVLGSLIGAYGAYKTAVMLLVAVQKAQIALETLRYFAQMTTALRRLTQAQILLNNVMGKNPYVKLAAILAAVSGAIWALVDGTQEAADNTNTLAGATERLTGDIKVEQDRLTALQSAFRDTNISLEDRRRKLEEFKNIVPGYLATLSDEGTLINDNTAAIDTYIASFEKRIKVQAYEDTLKQLYTLEAEQKKAVETAKKTLQQIEGTGANYDRPLIDIASVFGIDAFGKAESTLQNALDALLPTQTEIQRIKKELSGLYTDVTSPTDTNAMLTPAEEEKIQKAQEAYAKATLDAQTQYQKELDDLRRSSTTDEIARIELERDITLKYIEEERQAYIALAKVVGKYSEATDAQDTKVFYDRKQIVTETSQNEIDIYNAEQALKQKEADEARIRQEKETLTSLLEEYATYQQKRQALTAQYTADVSLMQGVAGTSVGITDDNITNRTKEYEIALQDLDVETAKTLGVLGKLWGNFANIAGSEIDKVIAEAESLYALLNSNASYTPEIGSTFGITSEMFASLKDVENLADFRDRLDELIELSRKAKSQFDGLGASWRQMMEGAKSGAFEDFEEGLDGVLEKIGAATQLAEMFSEMLSAVAGESDGVQKVADALSGAMSGAAAGAALGPWGAAAGAAMGLITSGFNAAAEIEAEHQEILKEIESAQRNYEIAYQEFLRTIALEGSRDTQILGTFEYDAAVRGLQAYRDELVTLDNLTKNIGSIDTIIGSKTTGILWWKKQHDISDSLLNQYPQLIDAQGNFNAEVGRTVLETAKLSEENERALEDIVLAAEAAEDALQQIRDTLSSMFGDIGNSMGDAVADAVLNGTDVALAALDELEAGLGNFATEMAKSLAFGDIMADASEEMLAAWNIEDPAKRNAEIMAIFGELAKDSKLASEEQAALMEEWKKLAEAQGLDIFDTDTDRTGATTSGITATQDSVDEMSGKLTTMIYLGNQTVNGLNAMVLFNAKIETYQTAMFLKVTNIDAVLMNMYKAMETMKSTMNDINLKGVKIKN